MSNGNIITPLTPDENIEINKETPNDIYTPSDSPNSQTKEEYKIDIKNCCKKCNCFEIVFLLFFLIIISSVITLIVIKFSYRLIPAITIIYGFFSFIAFCIFCVMKLYQQFGKFTNFLVFLIADTFWCGFDFIFSYLDFKEIKEKNEFKAYFIIYLKFGEISIWVLMICFHMCLTYKKIGKICIDLPRESYS